MTNVTFESLDAGLAGGGTLAIMSYASGATTFRNCVIHDVSYAFRVQGGGVPGATCLVENCHIYNGTAYGTICNVDPNGTGNVASLTITGSWIHNTGGVYMFKSCAKVNKILYNRIGDEEGWVNSDNINDGQMFDFVKGGLTYVIGNVIQNTTDAASGRDVIFYLDNSGGAVPGWESQLYFVYNTCLLRRNASTNCLYCPYVSVPAIVANNVCTHDGAGTLSNGTVVNNSLMINSNLTQSISYGSAPLAVRRFIYDVNGYDCGDGPGLGNHGPAGDYENWDVLNVRPVDPNTFPHGVEYSNTSEEFHLGTPYASVLAPPQLLLVPGTNPLALPAAGSDGFSLTPTSQYGNMPQVAGVAGGTESRANATDAIGAYSFAHPTNHQPVATITSTLPQYIYEGWPTINPTATATDQDAGQTLSYQWTQTTGQSQTLAAPTALNTSFMVAAKSLTSRANELLTFRFVATDNGSPVMSSTPVTTSVTCYLCGDIDHDHAVILADLKLLVASWNTTPASPNWNLAADLDGDHAVILADLKLLVANWNRSLP